MGCNECLRLLSEFVDGTLGTVHLDAFVAHLRECMPCTTTREDFDLIVKLARELREDFSAAPPPPVLKESVFPMPLRAAANL
ncbi:MAG TPA: zf-HC2 domain-containing protein [Pyrinomonadaceae bacterium]|nr:zf-HC2 domain-containing protein [Pyrinomonadaceae bacterium]